MAGRVEGTLVVPQTLSRAGDGAPQYMSTMVTGVMGGNLVGSTTSSGNSSTSSVGLGCSLMNNSIHGSGNKNCQKKSKTHRKQARRSRQAALAAAAAAAGRSRMMQEEQDDLVDDDLERGCSAVCTNATINTTTTTTSSCRLMGTRRIDIEFRPLQESDRASIVALHEAWFPVRYKTSFYDSIVRNEMKGTGDPIFSRVAVVVHQDDARHQGEEAEVDANVDTDVASPLFAGQGVLCQNGLSSSATGLQQQPLLKHPYTPPLHTHQYNNININTNNHHPPSHSTLETNIIPPPAPPSSATNPNLPSLTTTTTNPIVGCIVGAFFQTSKLSPETTQILLPSLPHSFTRVFYIMTLGTLSEYRRLSLGSQLVQQCLAVAEKEESCAAVYLHVIVYNEAAIRFYERLGFARVDEIQDYYTIEGKHYNCYLYAKFLHGNQPGKAMWWWTPSISSSSSTSTNSTTTTTTTSMLSSVVSYAASSVWRMCAFPFHWAFASLRLKSS